MLISKYKISLLLKSIDQELLNAFTLVLNTKLKNISNIKCSTVSLPKKIKKITVLKSPHINKTSREQFEIRSYKNLITLNLIDTNISAVNILLIKLMQNLRPGILVTVKKNIKYKR